MIIPALRERLSVDLNDGAYRVLFIPQKITSEIRLLQRAQRKIRPYQHLISYVYETTCLDICETTDTDLTGRDAFVKIAEFVFKSYQKRLQNEKLCNNISKAQVAYVKQHMAAQTAPTFCSDNRIIRVVTTGLTPGSERSTVTELELLSPSINPMNAVKAACLEFITNTDTGRNFYERNHHYLTWDDFVYHVPNELCEKHGFRKKENPSPEYEIPQNLSLVPHNHSYTETKKEDIV